MNDEAQPSNTDERPAPLSRWPDAAELRAVFAELSAHYPELHVPSDEILGALAEESSGARRQEAAGLYIGATVTAVFLVLSFPVLVVWGYDIAASAQTAVLPYLDQSAYLSAHRGMLVGLPFAAFAAIVYSLILYRCDVKALLPPRYLGRVDGPWQEFEHATWRFRLYQLAMLYFALAVIILLSHSFVPGAQPYSAFATRMLIFVPIAMASVFPTLLVVILLSIVFVWKSKGDKGHVDVLRQLLTLLRLLKNVSSAGQLLMSQRVDALGRISRTATLLRDLYTGGRARSRVGLWTQERMDRIADNFLALSAWVAFPKVDSMSALKRRLVFYANTLIAGAWDEFPADPPNDTFPFAESPKRGYLRRLGMVIWLVLLIALPLLMYAAITIGTAVEIPEPLQTPAAFAYSVWVAACLLAHMEQLAPDAKSSLLEVIKLVFRRP